MLKKQESYVNLGNRQIQEGNTAAAIQTVTDGLNYYQDKIIKSAHPYPVADAALLVTALRNFANTLEANNPSCKPLVQDLTKRLQSPPYHTKEKIHKVKQRKE